VDGRNRRHLAQVRQQRGQAELDQHHHHHIQGKHNMELKKTHETIINSCLSCGYVSDGASTPDGREARGPKPGDFTVCLMCGHLAVYDRYLKFRQPNDEEMLAIAGDKRLLDLQWARGEVMKRQSQGEESARDDTTPKTGK
jgi:hypothetical protein